MQNMNQKAIFLRVFSLLLSLLFFLPSHLCLTTAPL